MAGSADAPAIVIPAPMTPSEPSKPSDWNAKPGVFWVYVIRSDASGALYTGQTNDLEGRLQQHNRLAENRSRYTKRDAGPWALVYQEAVASRREAMSRERFLKSGQGREWLRRRLAGGASPPQAD